MFLHQLPTYLVLTHLCIMLLDIDTGPYLRVSASTFVSNKYSGSNNYFAICEFQLSQFCIWILPYRKYTIANVFTLRLKFISLTSNVSLEALKKLLLFVLDITSNACLFSQQVSLISSKTLFIFWFFAPFKKRKFSQNVTQGDVIRTIPLK